MMFAEAVLPSQDLVLVSVLAWAGWLKLRRPSAQLWPVSLLVPRELRRGASQFISRTLATMELGTAVGLLLAPTYPIAIGAAAALTAGFTVYLVALRVLAPHEPCGCMGGGNRQVSAGSIARSLLLLAAAVAGQRLQGTWPHDAILHPLSFGIAAAEGAAMVALTIGVAGRRGYAHALQHNLQLSRRALPLAVRLSGSEPLGRAESRLSRSEPYRALSAHLVSGLIEQWSDGGTRFMLYEALYKSQKATAVFALPKRGGHRRITAALISDADGAVIPQDGPITGAVRIDGPPV